MNLRFKKLAACLLAASCLTSPLSGAQADDHLPAAPDQALATATTLKAIQANTPSQSISVPSHVLRVNPQAALQCGPITGGAPNPVIENRIKDFTTSLQASQTGRDLLAAAADYAPGKTAWICFRHIKGLHALYYNGTGVLAVGLNKTNNEITADAVHELRHLYQEKSGLFNIAARNDTDRIHVEYAGEADAEATAALVMWELKEAGNPNPWNQHNDHKSYGPRSICYAHITTSFKRAVEDGLRAPEAAQHAFRAWYRDRDLLSFYKNSALEGLSRANGAPDPASEPVVSGCDAPGENDKDRAYTLPSDEIAETISQHVGTLPSYNINFVKQGGGLKAILNMP